MIGSLASVGVLLGASVLSYFSDVQWQARWLALDLTGGAVHVLARWRAVRPGESSFGSAMGYNFTLLDASGRRYMWMHYGWRPRGFISPPFFNVTIPLWMAIVPAAACAGWAHRRWSRRRGEHTCRCCGYDLRATPDRCPECGTALRGTAVSAVLGAPEDRKPDVRR